MIEPRSAGRLHQLRGTGGELALIADIRQRAAFRTGAVRLGIGDDCALLRPRAGEEIAITTDLSIESRHFKLDWHPPESIGHRALARGLSDLAAMGARPLAAFLSLAIPGNLADAGKRPSWTSRFLDGFLDLAKAQKAPLAGGDLAESPLALADVVLVGAVPRGRALLRSGARPGDQLYVTGSLGGSNAGLTRLAGLARLADLAGKSAGPVRIPKSLATELAAHLYPAPRIAQGLWLQRRGAASAAIDLSDGLSTDLAHLCAESNVAAEVDAARLPVHANATLQQALHGGEDYELLFTAPASTKIPTKIAGVAITQIGRMVKRRAARPLITLLTGHGPQALERRGWEHFA
jgi:thiamine-monophosphate kinase